MSLSGPGLAVAASPCVPEQFPPSAFTLTTLLELRSLSLYTAQLENALKYFCVCVPGISYYRISSALRQRR